MFSEPKNERFASGEYAANRKLNLVQSKNCPIPKRSLEKYSVDIWFIFAQLKI